MLSVMLCGLARRSVMQWRKTQVQVLLLDKHSGKYYCRLQANGKQHRESLETDAVKMLGKGFYFVVRCRFG